MSIWSKGSHCPVPSGSMLNLWRYWIEPDEFIIIQLGKQLHVNTTHSQLVPDFKEDYGVYVTQNHWQL